MEVAKMFDPYDPKVIEAKWQRYWQTRTYHQSLETLLILMAPVVPHIADELWELTRHEGSIHTQDWPSRNEILAADDVVQIPIQVNGKVRAVVDVSTNASENDVKHEALSLPKIQQHIGNGEISGVIYVPNKIMNFLVD
jgi:leucyl-tRNA synthetase